VLTTVTEAVPDWPLLSVATTMALPAVDGAVYTPVAASIEPPPPATSYVYGGLPPDAVKVTEESTVTVTSEGLILKPPLIPSSEKNEKSLQPARKSEGAATARISTAKILGLVFLFIEMHLLSS
jgi:hypothetical protein